MSTLGRIIKALFSDAHADARDEPIQLCRCQVLDTLKTRDILF